MSSLKGKTISRTYQKLIQSDNEITDGTLKQVSTGNGTPTAMKLSTNKAEFQQLGVGTDGITPDGLLHVLSVSAGAVTASSFANQLTLENSGDAGLSILSGASSFGHIYFGDANDNDVGGISYDHSNDAMNFTVDGSQSMNLDKSGNLTIGGVLSQSEDRYFLDEYFHSLPYKDVQQAEVTQGTSATEAVSSSTKMTRITTYANDLAASDSQEFTFNNTMIHPNSHVLAYIINSSGAIADNAMVNVMVHDVDNGSCKIRVATNAVDIASQTFEIEVVVDPHIQANFHWSLDGTNAAENFITYAGSQPGLRVLTSGSDNDQVILHPKVSSQGNGTDLLNVTPWRNVRFSPEFETELNIAISTHSDIANQAIWAGMKLSNTGTYATDVDQAYFLYATDDDLGALTTNGNLHFVYSVAGVDYVTDLGIAVAVSTVYRLRIVFDDNAKISVFVNGVQYGLTHTPTTTTAGGVTQPITTSKSLATTSNAALIPVVGSQSLSAGTRFLYCHFIKISRTLA